MLLAYPLGDGVELAGLEPWHAEQFLAALDRYRDHLRTEIPASHAVLTVEDARQYLQRWADAHAADTRHLYGLWRDGEVVGCVQLFNFDAAMGTCEVGIWLGPEMEGRGVATRACRAVIGWALSTRGMARVQWTNSTTNVRSGAVARRLGMTREGLLRSSWKVGDARKDNEVWSILAEEWLAEDPQAKQGPAPD